MRNVSIHFKEAFNLDVRKSCALASRFNTFYVVATDCFQKSCLILVVKRCFSASKRTKIVRIPYNVSFTCCIATNQLAKFVKNFSYGVFVQKLCYSIRLKFLITKILDF